MRRAMVAALIALGVLACLTGKRGSARAIELAPQDGTPRLARVVAHPLERVVTAPGTLKARNSFKAFVPVDGVLLTLLPEGARVKKGEVLAKLDVGAMEDQLREKTINHEQTLLERRIRLAEYDLEGFEVENRVAHAEADLATARLSREQVERGIDFPEFVRLEESSKASGALRTTLEKSLAEMRPYVPRGFVSREELDKQEVRLSTETVLARVQSLERSLVTSGATADVRAKAARDVALAESQLELARVKKRTFEQRKSDGLSELDARLSALDEEQTAFREQVARGVIRSPVDGLVVHGQVPTVTGNVKPRVGTRVSRGSLFAEVVQPGQTSLELEVAEADALFLRPGLPVRFTADAFPGRVFRAKVATVRAALTGGQWSRWIFPDPRQLPVTAEVTAGDPGLLPQMAITAEVVVESRPRALFVPAGAVANDRVTRPDGTTKAVRCGRVVGQELEVVDGLAEGDEVLLAAETAGGAPTDYDSKVVEVKELPLTLTDAGTLEAIRVHDICLPDLEGDAQIEWLAPEGDSVKKGTKIAQFDPEAIVGKLKEKKLEIEVAEKDREVAVEQGKSDANTLGQAARVAELEDRIAALDEIVLALGERPRKLDDLAADLTIQRADIALVAKKLGLKEKLSGKGYVSAEEVKSLRQDLLNRTVNLKVAEVKYELARGGATELERLKTKSARERARLNRELARQKVESRALKQKLEVEKAELSVSKLKLTAVRFESIIASLTVTAPVDGTLVRLERWDNGLRKYREGDRVWEGTVFMQLADLGGFRVKGVVPEERVTAVLAGQSVRWWLTSFPGEVYEGRVTTVGRVARDRNPNRNWTDAETGRVFDVEIETKEKRPRFQPGVSVQFELAVASVKDAVVVPLKALYYDGSGPFVWLASGTKRRVVPGDEEKGEVHIVTGLAKGEAIRVARDR
jgi:HlyD family secretion protein